MIRRALRLALTGPRDSLQYRVATALALFVAVVVSTVLAALFLINDHLKNDLLNGLVHHEMSELVHDYPMYGPAAIPNSRHVLAYVVEPGQRNLLPPALRQLGPHVSGVTLHVDKHTYRVGTREVDGRRFYLAYDITKIESREGWFKAIAIAAALAILALAIPLGAAIARFSLRPINALADDLGRLHPNERTTRLADRFEHYEVGVIAQAFDRFKGRLDEFVERERSFTADASHELRTPLAVIQGAVEVLQQDPNLSSSGPITRIDRAAHQMAELIESLLFLARDEPHQADGQAPICRADDVIRELLDAYRPLTVGKRVEIGPLDPLQVAAPRIALVIAFGNLMRNAVRHGGEEIRVTLSGNRLVVADNGCGMDAVQIARAFERGYSAGPGSGLGLGLYLVKRVADRYHWRIRLASRLQEGTSIELWLI